ncbi:hypothetical protein FA13DRAFT_1719926 [Coprinellus micaceus]|uniref:Uncharacterized protein n=1 Tax=Coprinellus micaceus TaxID=71717 RepID=A0A4Y7SB67_COPMI|nr:hypothetical protein FA13DRAFT_1719926 [Coprinellus micaceus]
MSFDGKPISPSNLVSVPDNHYVIDVPDLYDIIDVDKELVSGTDDIMAGRIQGLDLMTKQSGPDGWIQASMGESSSWRQSSGSMLDQDQAGGWTEPGWARLDTSSGGWVHVTEVVQSQTGKVDKFDDPPITDPETMPNSRSHPGEFMGGIWADSYKRLGRKVGFCILGVRFFANFVKFGGKIMKNSAIASFSNDASVPKVW